MSKELDMLFRAQGCFMGQLVGDALGATVEFDSADDIALSHPNGVREMLGGGHHKLAPGQITDDSEMALALIRSIIKKGTYDVDAVKRAYITWKNTKPFGMGRTTRKGLEGKPLYESQANGAMMRISPVGILGAVFPDQAIHWAVQDAELTHINPVCVQANMLYVMALCLGIRGGFEPKAIYRVILTHASSNDTDPVLMEAIKAAADRPPADYYVNMGWVITAFHNALYQLLHAESAEAGIIDTVRRGGDTDTNAAIAGALLGAVYGMVSIPRRWADTVLACQPNGLHVTECPRPDWLWPGDALELVEKVLNLGK